MSNMPIDIDDQKLIDVYVAKRKTREANFGLFRDHFTENKLYGTLWTTVQTPNGRVDKIEIIVSPDPPQVSHLDLSKEEPVSFLPTNSKVYFQRYQPTIELTPEKQTGTALESLSLDLIDPDEPILKTAEELETETEKKPDRIKADLQKKFEDLGINNLPLIPWLLRLFQEKGILATRIAIGQAKVLLPIFRSLEIKRLASNPTDPDSGYLATATQRQYVYNQLTRLTKEAGMTPAQETEFLMGGIYDSHHVGGFTVFSDKGNNYLVVDYTFGGYDENHPVGTDFTGNYRLRSSTELINLLNLAKAKGYQTHYCSENVSGGTHRYWNWHGIKIDSFDEDSQEKYLAKILEILTDIGVEPKSFADTKSLDFEDYMR